ncbi:MAG: TetR/AcrR family transcriptional regulator [Candidatus Aminicenantes bacterium]|nr:TetR/AcrR family transcriptional regulator [Candidatus Aminicenantes bacterium]
MPLKTFFNLSDERQKQIVDTCLEEFIKHDFKGASLTRIIKKLGLAKGSFYRYFESKKDLYGYLIDYGKRSTWELFLEEFRDPVEDILDAWVRFYLACVRQDNKYPLLGYFGYKLSQDKNNPILGDVPYQTLKKGLEVLDQYFLRQQKNGKIRSDIDIHKLIYCLLQVQSGLLDFLKLKYRIDFEENVKSGKPLFPLQEKVLQQELEGFAGILRDGFMGIHKTKSGGFKNVE